MHTFDPLTDPRWSRFLERRPDASVFHSVPWLEALRKTYGYQPIGYSSARPGEELQDGIAACLVESWLTGRRLVSMPFSDHCEPLVNDRENAEALFDNLREDSILKRCKYVEVRPLEGLNDAAKQFQLIDPYYLHVLDLSPSIDEIFRVFHKDCVQRKIKRATRERLVYSEGRSEQLLSQFYHLLLLTRRRHQVPPQPLAWYHNLISCFGEDLKIRIAYKEKTPVASILTLQHKGTLMFKYGCSDPAWHNLGGMHLLFWKSIEEAKERGLQAFDLGRSKTTNTGLVTFKERWGARRSSLNYYKYSASNSNPAWIDIDNSGLAMRFARHLFSHAPPMLLSAAGNLCYRHMG